MKRLVAILLCAFALCVGLVSCAGVSRDAVIGTWDYDIDTLSLFVGEGLTDEQVQAARQLMFLNLNDDGSAEFVLFGESQSGTWKTEGSKIVITIGGEESTAKLENDMLIMGEGDTPLSFVKASDPREVPKGAQVTAAMEVLLGSGTVDEPSGNVADPLPNAQIELTELDEPMPIADDDVATITATAEGTNALGDPGFNLHVVNKSGATLFMTEGEFFVDGQAVTVYGGDVFAPGDEKDVFLAFDAAGLPDGMTVDALGNVQGTIALNDDATTEMVASYEFVR